MIRLGHGRHQPGDADNEWRINGVRAVETIPGLLTCRIIATGLFRYSGLGT